MAIAIVSLAAIICAANWTRPFYLIRGAVGKRLVEHAYVDSTAIHAPWSHSPTEVALRTPQFLLDRERFAMDLMRTGHATVARARSLADVAVREAYTRKIPPALVLGVMLTENDALKSTAKSNVGAVGLMQVSGKQWRSALREKFGSNLHTDSTNLKYGIYILGWVAQRAAALVGEREGNWRTALLRYNGCVNGTNTRDCYKYPEVVRRRVEQSAKSTCPSGDFDRCVVQPMWVARGAAVAADTAINRGK